MRHRRSCLRSAYVVFTFRYDVFRFRFVVFEFLVLPSTPHGYWVCCAPNALYLHLPLSTLSNMWINTRAWKKPIFALTTEALQTGQAAIITDFSSIESQWRSNETGMQEDCKKAAGSCTQDARKLQAGGKRASSRLQESCMQNRNGIQKCRASMPEGVKNFAFTRSSRFVCAATARSEIVQLRRRAFVLQRVP
jgi:hypothetical protein